MDNEVKRQNRRFGLKGWHLVLGTVVLLPSMRGMCLADVLDSMEECIEAARSLSAERLRRFRRVDNEMSGPSFFHAMAKLMIPGISSGAQQDLRARAHLSLAGIALAIERYRLATGRAPERLEELVPRYLERVPTDPFDGRPIRYRRTDPGYLLYSVDTDGQDDGGRERSKKERGTPGDLCFIVTR